MKEYVKPTLDVVELRLDERVARCYNQPNSGKSASNPGDTPGLVQHCPSAS